MNFTEIVRAIKVPIGDIKNAHDLKDKEVSISFLTFSKKEKVAYGIVSTSWDEYTSFKNGDFVTFNYNDIIAAFSDGYNLLLTVSAADVYFTKTEETLLFAEKIFNS
jgi:hypothetical protein